ncbi:MAG: hypothetical protein HY823_09565 [Acidobacteria bacterium]|nr:hypothetical protein [Acidobacteriota bacterium]
MTSSLLLAPEQPMTWLVWVVWAFLCALSFPALAASAGRAHPPQVPYSTWAQVETGYDASSLASFDGVIAKVRLFQFAARGPALGVEIPNGERTTLVLIAPMSYLASKGRLVGRGLRIKGSGSRQTLAFGDLIIAREVTLQGRPLKLRDECGRHVWNPRRPKPPISDDDH